MGVLVVSDIGQSTDVELTYTRNQSHHDPEEFVDQAYDQGLGLSERKAGDSVNTIDEYTKNGRPKEAADAIVEFKTENSDFDFDGVDVLHKTDVCAGGDPTCISGIGDSGINRSLGAQNGKKTESIRNMLNQVDPNSKPTVRVNIVNNAGE